MIQVNATTHTKGGLTVSTGSVLDVTPRFITRRVFDSEGVCTGVEYDVAYDVDIYKSLSSYENGDDKSVNGYMKQYNIGFVAKDVDIQALSSVTDLLDILKDHVENGDESYSGAGVGKTAVVYPFSV